MAKDETDQVKDRRFASVVVADDAVERFVETKGLVVAVTATDAHR